MFEGIRNIEALLIFTREQGRLETRGNVTVTKIT